MRLWDISAGFELYRYDVLSEAGTPLSLSALAVDPSATAALTVLSDRSMRLWRTFPNADAIINWARNHRYVPYLSCDERIQFNILSAERVFVNIPDGGTLALQSAPGNVYDAVAGLDAGEPLQRISGQQQLVEGQTWQQVCTLAGVEGWVLDGALVSAGP